MPRLPLGDWTDSAVTYLRDHFGPLFDVISAVVSGMYDGLDAVLQAPHPSCSPGSSRSSRCGCAA